jgi:hypothetical protein
MRELALHILDIAENGIAAGADLIEVAISEDRQTNRLEIAIKDNGRGIDPEHLDKLTDPFVTSRTTRRVGLGLSLFEAAARRCNGALGITSRPGQGTRVTASFERDHIDRAPLGDMAGTLTTLIAGYPDIDFAYVHRSGENEFSLDTRDLRRELDGTPLNTPAVIRHLGQSIRRALQQLAMEA